MVPIEPGPHGPPPPLRDIARWSATVALAHHSLPSVSTMLCFRFGAVGFTGGLCSAFACRAYLRAHNSTAVDRPSRLRAHAGKYSRPLQYHLALRPERARSHRFGPRAIAILLPRNKPPSPLCSTGFPGHSTTRRHCKAKATVWCKKLTMSGP